jgi:hypothetical protein
MKIKRNDEKNINKNSKVAIQDFQKKQILTNILYHKIFLGMCVFVNVGLLIFILMYKNQLQKIELLTKKYTREYQKNEETLGERRLTLDHKLVNIMSISKKSNDICFAYSFENKTEYEMVYNFIIQFYINNPSNSIDIGKFKLQLIYQSTTDEPNFDVFSHLLNFHKKTLFIIDTVEDKKFGIYLDEMIFFENIEFVSKENKMFLFSFQTKQMYKYIGKGPGLKINKENILEIGNEEIIIYNNFYNNGGYINFPLKGFKGLNENIFTEGNGKFDLKKIEVFTFARYKL